MLRQLADTPARHVHRALELLQELEEDLRGPTASTLSRHDHVGLVVAARRRLCLAATALESLPQGRVARSVRQSTAVGRLILKAAAFVAFGAVLLVRSAWRSLCSLLRLVLLLRAI